jgi:hypothetical protein
MKSLKAGEKCNEVSFSPDYFSSYSLHLGVRTVCLSLLGKLRGSLACVGGGSSPDVSYRVTSPQSELCALILYSDFVPEKFIFFFPPSLSCSLAGFSTQRRQSLPAGFGFMSTFFFLLQAYRYMNA